MSNLKGFKKFLDEVEQPKPKGEKKFKDKHTIKKTKQAAGEDSQFDGAPVTKAKQTVDGKDQHKGATSEEVEDTDAEGQLDEDVLSQLQDIVKSHQAKRVKFANGKSELVDATTANAIVSMFSKLDAANKKKLPGVLDKKPENLFKLLDLAFGGSKK